ncbi:hypothetical protein [Nocardia terpenica]|uniref:DUF8176 domain-containing protein n=1 Tax=Nocardia terpenica TaxID=455432 RepID=A0A164K9D4_9NOCA|nr:hypothetical protein [Nocardia terpenica]KZM71173.1 hypothetical protein AWN90_42485 [Nocardia terpenica]NQE89490.1 hypothetical protein [Nocardia terpenica]
MNDIDDRMPDQVILDDPTGEAVGLAHWLATRANTPDNATETAAPTAPAHRRWRAAVGGTCAVALAAAVTATAHHSPHTAPSGHAASPVIVAQTPAVSAVSLVSGDSAGCPRSSGEADLLAAVSRAVPLQARGGAQAVALFEAAYFRARDGGRARQVVAASAAIRDAAGIQAGIDSLPADTTYCVHIDALAAGLYAVEIHESSPGEPETVWRQQISTNDGDGHTMITAITPL